MYVIFMCKRGMEKNYCMCKDSMKRLIRISGGKNNTDADET